MQKKTFPDPAKPPKTLVSCFCFLRAFWRAIKSRSGLQRSRKCSDPYFLCPQRQQRQQSDFRRSENSLIECWRSEGTLHSNVVCSLGLSSLWMPSRTQLSGFGESKGTLIGFWEDRKYLKAQMLFALHVSTPFGCSQWQVEL